MSHSGPITHIGGVPIPGNTHPDRARVLHAVATGLYGSPCEYQPNWPFTMARLAANRGARILPAAIPGLTRPYVLEVNDGPRGQELRVWAVGEDRPDDPAVIPPGIDITEGVVPFRVTYRPTS